MRDYREKYKTQIQMNITSMMDVVFMLLIIFMITAPLMHAEVDVKLPKSSAAKVKDETSIVVSVTKSGEIYIGKSKVPIEAFGEEMKKLAASGRVTSISLKGDKDINYGIIMRVVGDIKSAGIENLGLVAIPEKKRGR
ncbi:biopolymer transporter ExbD [bacterium]|nr:biopolymer transporter ExbD [bacterium]